MRPFLHMTVGLCATFIFFNTPSSSAYAALGSADALKGLQITKPIYAWKTEHESNPKNGAFNHCLVKNMYDNGTILILAENNDGLQRLALHFPQDKMEPGQHFDLTIQIDKRDLFPVEAIAVSPQILTIGIPEALPDQIRKGQALYLRGPNDEVVYTLEGADGAVTALRDCVMTQKNPELRKVRSDTRVADAQAPALTPITPKADKPLVHDTASKEMAFVSDAAKDKKAEEIKAVKTPVTTAKTDKIIETAPAEKPIKTAAVETKIKPIASPPKEGEKRVVEAKTASIKPVQEKPAPVKTEAKPALKPDPKPVAKVAEKPIAPEPTLLPPSLHAIFSPAGLAPKTLLSKKAPDYVWQHKELLVSAKEDTRTSPASFEKTGLHYLNLLKQRCTGVFVAEAAPVMKNKTGTADWQIAETACSSKNGRDTINALLFTQQGKTFRVFLIEGSAKHGADAIKLRDHLLPYAFR